jgi:hypothetical protein
MGGRVGERVGAGQRAKKGRPEGRPFSPCLVRPGGLKWQPALLLRKLHIADIGAEPQPGTDADRDEHNIAAAQIARVEPAHQIGNALARGEAAVQIFGVVKIIDQHKGAARIGTRVETDRRAGPVNRFLALNLVMQRARAIAQAHDQRATTFAADNIAVGLPCFLRISSIRLPKPCAPLPNTPSAAPIRSSS